MNGSLGTGLVVETDKSEAFALIGGAVYEDLGADDVSEGEKHLHKLGVPELLRQVVDEEVTSLWSTQGAA